MKTGETVLLNIDSKYQYQDKKRAYTSSDGTDYYQTYEEIGLRHEYAVLWLLAQRMTIPILVIIGFCTNFTLFLIAFIHSIVVGYYVLSVIVLLLIFGLCGLFTIFVLSHKKVELNFRK